MMMATLLPGKIVRQSEESGWREKSGSAVAKRTAWLQYVDAKDEIKR